MTDIRARIGLSNIVLVANHGFQISEAGTDWVHPSIVGLRPFLKELVAELNLRFEGIRNLTIEDKIVTLSVHYRNVNPARISFIKETILRELKPYRTRFKITCGKKVFEIRPNVLWDKGKALLHLLNQRSHLRSRLILYCGDDVTDEDAFRRLPREAITVAVGNRYGSKARFYVRSVAGVHTILKFVSSERNKV